MPRKINWAEEHVEDVCVRYKEIKEKAGDVSLTQLAREFGVARQTLAPAFQIAKRRHEQAESDDTSA